MRAKAWGYLPQLLRSESQNKRRAMPISQQQSGTLIKFDRIRIQTKETTTHELTAHDA